MDSYIAPSTKPLYRGTQIVWYIFGVLEAFLLLRFILKLLGANTSALFTKFIYSVSDIFVAPFVNVFHITAVAGSVFEWATLLALVIYYLVAWGIIELLVMSRSVSTPQAARKLENQEKNL